MARAPVAAGAAIGRTVRTAAGRSSPISSATMPPSEPPVATASSPMPRTSRRRQVARAWSRVETSGNLGAVLPARGRIDRTSGRSSRSGRRAGWRRAPRPGWCRGRGPGRSVAPTSRRPRRPSRSGRGPPGPGAPGRAAGRRAGRRQRRSGRTAPDSSSNEPIEIVSRRPMTEARRRTQVPPPGLRGSGPRPESASETAAEPSLGTVPGWLLTRPRRPARRPRS